MIYARKTIYQDPTYPWKQPGMPEQAVFKIVKKVHFIKVSHLGLSINPLHFECARLWHASFVLSGQ